tara:strand:- start:595 stop:1188 length:594 start_codon:yes stop_codon:yes gene_type:complete
MPNWTYNTVEITGSVENVQNFLDLVKVTDDKGVSWYDFTQCNPIPDDLRNIHQGGATIDGVRYDAWYEDEDGKRPMMDMVKDRLVKDYGTYQPIDWQYLNWGTKWGDCDTTLISDTITKDSREVVFQFDSAWGEPFRLLNDIAIKFNLTIVNSWDIELGNGDGVSEYPWTPEDTERIYNEYEKSMQEMHDKVREITE